MCYTCSMLGFDSISCPGISVEEHWVMHLWVCRYDMYKFSVKYTYFFECTHMQTFTHGHMHTYTCTHAHTRTHIHTRTHAHTYTHTHTRTHIHMLQYGPVQYSLVTVNPPGISYRPPCTYYPITCSAAHLMKWLHSIKYKVLEVN